MTGEANATFSSILPTGITTERAWQGKKEKVFHSDFRLIQNIVMAL
jgi:hypothetical protein